MLIQPLIAKGQPVEILKSTHPDVKQKSVGIVEDVFQDGYGVRVKANFYLTPGYREEERVIFFTLDGVREVK